MVNSKVILGLINMNIQRLKEIREDRDLTQKQISKVLNISQVVYSRYETGIRLIPIDKLVKLAEFYEVSLDYILGLTDEIKPYPKSIINNKNQKL